MPQIVASKPLAIVDPQSGELIEISTGPLTVEEAAARLPFVQRTLRELKRFEGFLMDSIAASFVEGQSQKRLGDQLFEYRGETEWTITDEGALFRVLVDACAHGELAREELDAACSQVLSFRFHQGKLSTLQKRIPAIASYRRSAEGAKRLKVK